MNTVLTFNQDMVIVHGDLLVAGMRGGGSGLGSKPSTSLAPLPMAVDPYLK
jgi:hypothetical protein